MLDNCEHLAEAAAERAAELIAACPRVGVLATSRGPLGLRGEQVYRLSPLATRGRRRSVPGSRRRRRGAGDGRRALRRARRPAARNRARGRPNDGHADGGDPPPGPPFAQRRALPRSDPARSPAKPRAPARLEPGPAATRGSNRSRSAERVCSGFDVDAAEVVAAGGAVAEGDDRQPRLGPARRLARAPRRHGGHDPLPPARRRSAPMPSERADAADLAAATRRLDRAAARAGRAGRRDPPLPGWSSWSSSSTTSEAAPPGSTTRPRRRRSPGASAAFTTSVTATATESRNCVASSTRVPSRARSGSRCSPCSPTSTCASASSIDRRRPRGGRGTAPRRSEPRAGTKPV